MEWIASCESHPELKRCVNIFERTFESESIPSGGDEIRIEDGDFVCEMVVMSHRTWHLVSGKIVPTVHLKPMGGCKEKDFIALGFEPA